MKAIVCVKQVPDTSGKVSVKPDGTLDRASMATITNPDDLNALEAALKLKDATGGANTDLVDGSSQDLAGCEGIGTAELTARDQNSLISAAGQQLTQHALCRRGTHGDDNDLAGRQELQ